VDRSGRTLRGGAKGVEGRLRRHRRGGPEEDGGDEEEPHACAATEQRIGGGLLESGVFFRPGRLRLSLIRERERVPEASVLCVYGTRR